MDPRISVVIPVRNEAENLREVLPNLPDVHEIIVVDGNSTDGSATVAKDVRPEAQVINQTRKGKGNAMACGFAAATGDVIVMFDADGSADPAEIPAFIAALTIGGGDVAKGSRYLAGGGSEDITLLRSAGNKALNFLANRLFSTRFTDLCYGYNAFWRDAVEHIGLPNHENTSDQMEWGDGFEIETVLSCRFAAHKMKVREVPSVERERIHGESNLQTFRDGWRVLLAILDERRRAWSMDKSRPRTVNVAG